MPLTCPVLNTHESSTHLSVYEFHLCVTLKAVNGLHFQQRGHWLNPDTQRKFSIERRQRFDEQCSPTTGKTTSIKIRGGLKWNVARISAKLLRILDWLDFKQFGSVASSNCTLDSDCKSNWELLYNFEPSILPSESCNARSSWKKPLHNFFRSLHNFLNKKNSHFPS